jgi:undecaprenyl-diphosphatase
LLDKFILAITQGVSEFLPISSSGHLIIAENIMGIDPQKNLSFDILMHLATALALIIVLYESKINTKDFQAFHQAVTGKKPSLVDFVHNCKIILLSFYQPSLKMKSYDGDNKNHADIIMPSAPVAIKGLTKKIFPYLIASAPVAVAGLAFSVFDIVDQLRNFETIAITSALLGVAFLFMKNTGKSFQLQASSRWINFSDKSFKNLLLIGLIQPLALIPGVSRSGITTLAAVLLGYSFKDSLKISFFLFFPAVFLSLGDTLLKFIEGHSLLLAGINAILPFFAAFGAGYISAKYLLKYINRIGFKPFGVYRILLGLILLGAFFQ